jgi:hypothetical protein
VTDPRVEPLLARVLQLEEGQEAAGGDRENLKEWKSKLERVDDRLE